MAWLQISWLVLLVSGCDGPVGNFDGTVQYSDGEPVQSGSVEFRSLTDGSMYASRITSAGKFSLTDVNGEKGCPPGDYEVVVVQIVLTEDLAAELHSHGTTVPRRYRDYHTSGLKVTTAPTNAEPIRIVLEKDSE